MSNVIQNLLKDIFGHDFSACKSGADVRRQFFAQPLELADLGMGFEAIRQESVEAGGRKIPAAIHIGGHRDGLPFCILAQLHGNESAGIAGILLAMALKAAGALEQSVVGVIGNPLAAWQYFQAVAANPLARQETRDCYRCGLADDGSLLPDMNRIPVDFMQRPPADPHTRRAQELFTLGQHISGMLDIHTARGNMLAITDHKHDRDLKYSPIRAVLIGLADAISANASSAVTVKTLKTMLMPLPNLKHQTGIEAGRHEDPDAPHHAAATTLAMLHAIGATEVEPLDTKETGVFERYDVKPRLTYADLPHKPLSPDDRVYMVKECSSESDIPKRSDQVIVEKKDGSFAVKSILEHIVAPAGKLRYVTYQYDEMEAVKKNQVLAVAVPSGVAFKAPRAFSGIFFSKSARLYDRDPAVGPWPVSADNIAATKFCYPCDVGKMKLSF